MCKENSCMKRLIYRTWQIGFFCSTRAEFNLTVNAQVDGAATAVVGDCQYVLLRVIDPPQLDTTSAAFKYYLLPVDVIIK